jgi:hypothetical protein
MDMIEDSAARALGRKPEPEGTPEERTKRAIQACNSSA